MLTISGVNFAQKTNSKLNTVNNQSNAINSNPISFGVALRFNSDVVNIRYPKRALASYSKNNPLFESSFRLFERVKRQVFEPGMELISGEKFERAPGALLPEKLAECDEFGIKVVAKHGINIALIRSNDDPQAYKLVVKDVGLPSSYEFEDGHLYASRYFDMGTGNYDMFKSRHNREQLDIERNKEISNALQTILDEAKAEEEKGLKYIADAFNFPAELVRQ